MRLVAAVAGATGWSLESLTAMEPAELAEWHGALPESLPRHLA